MLRLRCAESNTEREKQCDHRRTAVTDKRQRYADDRHNPEAHADILDRLTDNNGGNTRTYSRAGAIRMPTE